MVLSAATCCGLVGGFMLRVRESSSLPTTPSRKANRNRRTTVSGQIAPSSKLAWGRSRRWRPYQRRYQRATQPVMAERLKTIQLLPVILVPLDRPGQTFLETDSG
jgi:hypothetical protein